MSARGTAGGEPRDQYRPDSGQAGGLVCWPGWGWFFQVEGGERGGQAVLRRRDRQDAAAIRQASGTVGRKMRLGNPLVSLPEGPLSPMAQTAPGYAGAARSRSSPRAAVPGMVSRSPAADTASTATTITAATQTGRGHR